MDNAETREDFDAHERAQIADFRRASKFTRIVAAAFAILAIWLLFAVARRYALGAGAGMPWWQELLVYVVALQLTFAVAEIVGLALFVRHVSGPRRGMRFSPRLVRPYAMRSATSVVVAAVVALVTWGAEQRHPGWWLLGLVPVVVLAALLASNTYASLRVMYRLRRLADPRVQAVVDDVAHAAGMRAPQVLVLPASDYGGVMNAWAASSGWSRGVVVLFDTVLSMPEPELRNLVAHELGHIRLRHLSSIRRRIVVIGAVAFVVGMFLAGYSHVVAEPTEIDTARMSVTEWLGHVRLDENGIVRFDSDGIGEGAPSARSRPPQYVDYAMIAMGTSVVVNLLYALPRSRRDEAAADAFALDLTRDPNGFRSLVRRLTVANAAPIEARGLRGVGCTHPPASARMAMADAWARANRTMLDD